MGGLTPRYGWFAVFIMLVLMALGGISWQKWLTTLKDEKDPGLVMSCLAVELSILTAFHSHFLCEILNLKENVY